MHIETTKTKHMNYKDITKIQGRWSAKELQNIAKIATMLQVKDYTHYPTGGGCENIVLHLNDGRVIVFDNFNAGVQCSKITYKDLEHEFYNDEHYENWGWIPNVEIKDNYSNWRAIVDAILNPGDWKFAYENEDGTHNIHTLIIEKFESSDRTIILFIDKFRQLIGVNFYQGWYEKPLEDFMTPNSKLTKYVIENLLELWDDDVLLIHPHPEYNDIIANINTACEFWLDIRLEIDKIEDQITELNCRLKQLKDIA